MNVSASYSTTIQCMKQPFKEGISLVIHIYATSGISLHPGSDLPQSILDYSMEMNLPKQGYHSIERRPAVQSVAV